MPETEPKVKEKRSLLEMYGIDLSYVHPDVDPKLCIMKDIKESQRFGNFFNRIMRRIDLVDDFRSNAIACAGFNPTTRRISITFNPFLLWGGVLRPNVTDKNILAKYDQIFTDSFKNGGWIKDKYLVFIQYVNSQKVDSYYSSRSKRTSSIMSTLITSIWIHEMMHCMWNHISFQRQEDIKNPIEVEHYRYLTNLAMDFAINQTLSFGNINHSFMTVDNRWLLGCFAKGGAKIEGKLDEKTISIDKFDEDFLNQPYEYYYQFLKNNSKEDLEKLKANSKIKIFEDFGNFYDYFKHVLGEMSKEDKQKMADTLAGEGVAQFEDFSQTTSEMKKVSANDMKRVIDEMLASGEISKPEDFLKDSNYDLNKYFTKMIEGLYKTDAVSWERALQYYLLKAVGSQDFSHSMKREHRSVPDFFPGKIRAQGLDVALIVDVSGSINKDDYNRFVNEMEKMDRIVESPTVRYIQFHSVVAMDKVVPIRRIRHLGIASTGGTHLASALDLLKKECNTKLTVVFTDGYVEDTVKQSDYNFPVVMFCSSSSSKHTVQELRKRFSKVIYQDEDNSFFLK